MTAPYDLLQVQAGKETTWGTEVAPTAKLMAVESCQIQPIVTSAVHHDVRASLAPGHLKSFMEIGGQASLGGKLTYEDMGYLFDSLASEATPGGVNPYTRDWTGGGGAATTPRKLTLAYGDSNDCRSLLGGLVNELTIAAQSGQPWTYQASLIGKEVVDDALAALSDRTVELVMGDNTALYIDAAGGTIGATAIANTWFSFEWKVSANRNVVRHNKLKPTTWVDKFGAGSLKLTVEVNATTLAYLDSIITASATLEHQIRITATSGTKIARLDMAAIIAAAPAVYQTQQGAVAVDLNYIPIYNTALANWWKAHNQNAVAVLA